MSAMPRMLIRKIVALLGVALLGACGTANDSRNAGPGASSRHYTVFATLIKGQPIYDGQLDVIPWVPVHALLAPVQATASVVSSTGSQPQPGVDLSLICQAVESGTKLLCDLLLETREPRLEQTKARVALEVGKQATSSIRGFQLVMKATPN